MPKTRICQIADIPANGMKECTAESGLKLLVANSGEAYFAVQAICPHQEVALCEGFYDGAVLTCHQHLWQWDIKTGAPIGMAEAPLECFDVSIEGDAIYVNEQGALNVGEIFSGVGTSTLTALTAAATLEDFEAGTFLYRLGDRADDVFILESGRVEFQIGRDDRMSPAGFMLRKGEVFGWAALLEEHPTRIASARVLEKSTLLRMNGAKVLKILEADPASGYQVMRRLSGLVTRFLAQSGAK